MLRSTPGEGTTFDVVLPLSKGEEVLDGQPASGIEHQAQSRGRLLVVDPDATVRRSVKRMLGHQGFAVLTAANGAEALEIVRRDDGDLRAIIIDLNLPAESGPDTIRALNAMTDIPVLVSSGYGEKVIRNKTGDLTVAGLLPKPYSLEELTSMLAGTLSASMN